MEYQARGFDDIVPVPMIITFLPLYHAMGLFGMFWGCWNGSSQIMMAKFNLERYLQHVEEHSVSYFDQEREIGGISRPTTTHNSSLLRL